MIIGVRDARHEALAGLCEGLTQQLVPFQWKEAVQQ